MMNEFAIMDGVSAMNTIYWKRASVQLMMLDLGRVALEVRM